MQFQAEIALLQGSFYCESGLVQTCQKQRANVTAICHALREIIHGLESDRNDDEKRHWNFRLHAIFFCKMIEKRQGRGDEHGARKKSHSAVKSTDNDCWLRYFEGVSRALPDCVDLSVYLDVAKNFKWGSLCAQVLISLESEAAQVLLEELTAECTAEGHLDLLTDILTGLLTYCCNATTETATSKCSGGNTNRVGTVVNNTLVVASCEQILGVKSRIENGEQQFDVIQALVLCLHNVVFDFNLVDADQETQSHFDDSKLRESSVEFLPLLHRYHWNNQSRAGQIYQLHLLSSLHHKDCTQAMNQANSRLQSGSQSLRQPGGAEVNPETKKLLLATVAKLLSVLHTLLLQDWSDCISGPCNSNNFEPSSSHSPEDGNATDETANSIFLVLRRLIQCLGQISAMPWEEHAPTDFELVQQQCSELTARVLETWDKLRAEDSGMALDEKVLVAMETDGMTNGKRGLIWLQEAISRVDARLEGYEDDLVQLLSSSDLWEEISWIECLERNTQALALPGFMRQLVDVAVALDRKETDESILQRVLKVLLASFASLPFPLQNSLRDYLWNCPGGVSLFSRHRVGNFDQDSTSAFNRLVTLTTGQQNMEVLTAVSCLALQFLAQTLQQAVSRAVSNAAVCQAVCQVQLKALYLFNSGAVHLLSLCHLWAPAFGAYLCMKFSLLVLQAMPSLAAFKLQGHKWPLLCHLIQRATGMEATSASEEANLVHLVTTLLQPYKPLLDPNCPFLIPPVLPTQGVTQVCILPHLNHSWAKDGDQTRLVMALKLLDEVLKFQKAWTGNSDRFLYGSSVFPIMLCLCELLDSCHLLWDGVATAMPKVEVKELVLCILGQIGRAAASMHEDGADDSDTQRGMSWLMDRVSATMHWTTTLCVKELSSGCLRNHTMKNCVPECLFGICKLEASDWSPIPSIGTQRLTSPSDQLTDLLLCCRISDNLASTLSQSIQLDEATSHQAFREAFTLALVQVLPHCIVGEWQCIMGMLKQLLTDGVLLVPCSICYVTELPMVNMLDFKVHLSLSQLLLSVMQLLTGPSCEDWATPQLLHHVTRCYIKTMQTVTSDMLNSDLCSASGSLFVIGQVFCHACEIISILPIEEMKEQVFVLALEFLSQMEELQQVSSTKKGFDLDWANQRTVLELLTNQKLAGEQRQMLLQKIGGSRQEPQS